MFLIGFDELQDADLLGELLFKCLFIHMFLHRRWILDCV